MSTKNTTATVINYNAASAVEVEEPRLELDRKQQFLEPEISTPVDVLEATTFFQAATSGATN